MSEIMELLNKLKMNKNVHKVAMCLNNKKLDGENCKVLFNDLKKISHVEELSFESRNNWIMDEGMAHLSDYIIYCKPLKELRLNLYNNEI